MVEVQQLQAFIWSEPLFRHLVGLSKLLAMLAEVPQRHEAL
jgi:hypothetical protein